MKSRAGYKSKFTIHLITVSIHILVTLSWKLEHKLDAAVLYLDLTSKLYENRKTVLKKIVSTIKIPDFLKFVFVDSRVFRFPDRLYLFTG